MDERERLREEKEDYREELERDYKQKLTRLRTREKDLLERANEKMN